MEHISKQNRYFSLVSGTEIEKSRNFFIILGISTIVFKYLRERAKKWIFFKGVIKVSQ